MGRGGRSKSRERDSCYGYYDRRDHYSPPSRWAMPAHPMPYTQPPAMQQPPSMSPGFGNNIAQGVALGAASGVAHQSVKAAMGNGTSGTEVQPVTVQTPQITESFQNPQQSQNPCQFEMNNLSNCVE